MSDSNLLQTPTKQTMSSSAVNVSCGKSKKQVARAIQTMTSASVVTVSCGKRKKQLAVTTPQDRILREPTSLSSVLEHRKLSFKKARNSPSSNKQEDCQVLEQLMINDAGLPPLMPDDLDDEDDRSNSSCCGSDPSRLVVDPFGSRQTNIPQESFLFQPIQVMADQLPTPCLRPRAYPTKLDPPSSLQDFVPCRTL